MLLWGDLCRQLSYVWSTKEQYAYGWFVPILALGLLGKRWSSRPGPFQAEQETRRSSFLAAAGIFLLFLPLLPLRVIHAINQDWPLASWALAIWVVAVTLCAVNLVGGRPWVKHFAFPICFILVAVQWPSRIENPLTTGLMHTVAGITVEALNWLGIPAMQRGNLIDLASCTVGVDEACSGIRSLQSSLMAGLFLGELYMLRWPLRLLLIAIGICVAFLLNVLRTFILSHEAAKAGLQALEKWHDPAGFTIAIACFFVVWVIAVWIKRTRGNPKSTKLGADCEITPKEPNQASGSSRISSLQPLVSQLFLLRAKRFAVVVGVWSCICIGATELWYRSHELTEQSFLHWTVALPKVNPTFQAVNLPPRTQKLLNCDFGIAGKWQEGDGSQWSVYFFQWAGKSIQSIMAARYHRPEVCLPASGLEQIGGSKNDYFQVLDLKLPFRESSYAGPGQVVYVFYCIWQDGDERRKGMRSRDASDRLLGPLEGRRSFGQQVLEIITTGYASAADAEKAVRQRLPGMVRIVKHTEPATVPIRQ